MRIDLSAIRPSEKGGSGIDPSEMNAAANLMPSSRLPEERQQVAAVCYRIVKRGPEFLLVQTRGGRWIFPKGGAEPGLTYAQSAALEAFEEAGVHGRIEAIPFARYFRRKTDHGEQPEGEVIAHLCEVSHLEKPQEANRNPTWFSAEKAKLKLLERRRREFGAELSRIVDRAVARIQRLHSTLPHSSPHLHTESLRDVHFEDAHFRNELASAALARHFLYQRQNTRAAAAIEAEWQPYLRKVPQTGKPAEIRRPLLRLGMGVSASHEKARNINSPRNITPIDSKSRVALTKPANLQSNKRRGWDKN